MLISRPTGTSTIRGAFHVMAVSFPFFLLCNHRSFVRPLHKTVLQSIVTHFRDEKLAQDGRPFDRQRSEMHLFSVHQHGSPRCTANTAAAAHLPLDGARP
jgi:hypothetical protein